LLPIKELSAIYAREESNGTGAVLKYVIREYQDVFGDIALVRVVLH
jgi:stringent starvation protein B